jgi:hypothetical protein
VSGVTPVAPLCDSWTPRSLLGGKA